MSKQEYINWFYAQSPYWPTPDQQFDKLSSSTLQEKDVEGEKFYAVEYSGYWNIQTVPGYEENDNILDADSVGAKQAEENANLITKLLNEYYGNSKTA